MNIRVVGLNHRSASIDVRESLAFSPSQVAEALLAWQDTRTEPEAVLLSTCNRTEFYVASEDVELPSTEQLLKFLLRCKANKEQGTEALLRREDNKEPGTEALLRREDNKEPGTEALLRREDNKEPGTEAVLRRSPRMNDPEPGFTLASQIFTLDGLEAVEHLFSVASSLDSMVLGEAQILSQVKSAYQTALETETVGPLTHALFQAALKTAKQVATETELHRHRVSIPSIAVIDFALRVFEQLNDKRILVFGAGEMGRETLQYLREHGARTITVLNRNRARAESSAAEFGGRVEDWERRVEQLVDADIVVSTTGAAEPVVTLEDFRRIKSTRIGRPLFVLDLAVPRDFDPAIGEEGDVYLYSVDDLRDACERNQKQRDREIPKARRIVAQAAGEFVQGMNHRHSGDMIRELRERWNRTKDTELQRLFNKLPELDERETAEIRYAFDRLVGKFLHTPLESLRDESRNGVPHKLLDALARLFRLRDH